MSTSARIAVISMPGTNSMPASTHAAAAASKPANVAWPVDGSTGTPAADVAAAELRRAFGEQATGGAFEEEERGPRLERRICGDQLRVALLERREVLAFFAGEFLEDAAPARIAGEGRRTRVEVQTAALGGDR